MLRNLLSTLKQNVPRNSLLRHYCTANTSNAKPPPQTRVTEVNRSVTLERHSDSAPSAAAPRPLVILLGWMFAKPAHLRKFANIYVEQGFDVLTVRVNPGQLLFPRRVQALVRELLDLCQSEDFRYQPLMSHGFSVGGYVYGELLLRLQTHPHQYTSIRRRLCAQVFDSPVDFEGIPKGLSRAVTGNPKAQSYLHKFLEWYLATFSNLILREYKRASEAFHANELELPSIFFYSQNDPVCDTGVIERLALSWRNRGLEANCVFWEQAPHVSTYRKYPGQYKHSLLAFINRSGVKGCNPARDVVEENPARDVVEDAEDVDDRRSIKLNSSRAYISLYDAR